MCSSYHGLSDDSMALCQSALALLRWLLDIIAKFVQKMTNSKLQAEYSTLLERGTNVLDKLVQSHENRALMYIAKHEYPGMIDRHRQTDL